MRRSGCRSRYAGGSRHNYRADRSIESPIGVQRAAHSVIIHDRSVTIGEGGCAVNGYHAQIDALRDAAKAAESAAEQVSDIDLASALGEAGDGMPGARCVQSFRTLGNAWQGDISDWTSQAHRYADAVTAADQYSENEQAAEGETSPHSPVAEGSFDGQLRTGAAMEAATT